MIKSIFVFILSLLMLTTGCGQIKIANTNKLDDLLPKIDDSKPGKINKWDLWLKGTKLRGANIFQRRVYSDLDGDSLGNGVAGSPFTQSDFNTLSNLGANWVQISHPGIFTEKPPYQLDKNMQDNLDKLLVMAKNANLFVTIAFRTGPGRSEFTFYDKEDGDWFPASYRNDLVWQDREAQVAWAEMWKYTASRYKDDPVVVGYNLMVEPNAESRAFKNDIDEPNDFYPIYADTLADWNQMYPKLVNSIRLVDNSTPIIVGGMGYSAVLWLDYLKPIQDKYIVYSAHQYAPFSYTHAQSKKAKYPGSYTDFGEKINLDKNYLNKLITTVANYGKNNSRPVTIDEYGVYRWQYGADGFMADTMEIMEKNGINYALWSWDSSHHSKNFPSDDQFDLTHGANKNNHKYMDNSLLNVVKKYWSKNNLRPYPIKQ